MFDLMIDFPGDASSKERLKRLEEWKNEIGEMTREMLFCSTPREIKNPFYKLWEDAVKKGESDE
jgi:hypothetical protein